MSYEQFIEILKSLEDEGYLKILADSAQITDILQEFEGFNKDE